MHIPTRQLKDALGILNSSIPSRAGNHDFTLVRLDASRDSLRLSGGGYDTFLSIDLSVDGDEEGAHYYPAAQLKAIIDHAPNELTELRFEESQLAVSSGGFKTHLQESKSEHERTPESVDFVGTLDGARLADALSKVSYACAVAEYQAVFRNVLVKNGSVVATDGFRLAKYRLPSELDALLPRASADLLAKIAQDTVEYGVVGTQLVVRTGNIHAEFALAEGTFPDYERVIPSSFVGSVTVGAAELRDALERVSVMADKTANSRVDLSAEGIGLRVSAEGSYGEAVEVVAASVEGDVPPLAFNVRYLVEALKPVDGNVTLRVSGTHTPTVIEPEAEPAYMAMAVPLRTG